MVASVVGTFMRFATAVISPVDALEGDAYVVFAVGQTTGPPDISDWHRASSEFLDAPDSTDVTIAFKRVNSDSEEVDFSNWGMNGTDSVFILNVIRFDTPAPPEWFDPTTWGDVGFHMSFPGYAALTDSEMVFSYTDGFPVAGDHLEAELTLIYAAGGDHTLDADTFDIAPVDPSWGVNLGSSPNPSNRFAVAAYSKNNVTEWTTDWSSPENLDMFLGASVVFYEVPEPSTGGGGGSSVGAIEWDALDARYFHHGVDRGVLYPDAGGAIAWNGITGMNESGNGSSTLYYLDGQIYLADVDPTDFSGSLTAYSYPDEFAECLGIPQVGEGLFMDNQKAKRFGFSYRSLVGSGVTGDLFGYQIHLVYKVMASIGAKQRKTVTATPDMMEMTFDLVATPMKVPGFRPTAHFILDTRYMTPDTVAEIEAMLYGVGETPGALPDPTVLFEMLSFGNDIDVHYYTATETLVIKGSSSNVHLTGPDSYQINNLNAVDNGDGTYDISDGGDTTVTVV